MSLLFRAKYYLARVCVPRKQIVRLIPHSRLEVGRVIAFGFLEAPDGLPNEGQGIIFYVGNKNLIY